MSACVGTCSGTCGAVCKEVCNDNCSGGCKSGCTSCSGGCKGKCTACTGNCKNKCDNGCTATSMAEVYENLGKDLVLNAVILAKDVNDIETYIIRELDRRSITPATTTAAAKNSLASKTLRDTIYSNCVKADSTFSTTKSNTFSAVEMKKYIDLIKTLYS